MNQSDESYSYNLDELLTTYGSTPFLDNLNLYPFTIFSALGLLLNLFTCFVYRQHEFRAVSIYQFFFIYAVTNVVLCLFSCFNFLATSYRIISWSNSYWTQFYYNYIYSPGINICYFYSSVLDIFVLIDRIAYFKVSVRTWFRKCSPFKMCLIGLIGCLIIDSPYCYVFMPGSVVVRLNSTTNFTIWFASTTPFATSTVGKVLSYLVYSIRDVQVMLIKVALNIISAYILKQFLDKKLTIVRSNTIIMADLPTTQSRRKSRVASLTESKSLAATALSKKAEKANRNSTLMVIILCMMSICQHILTMVMILYAYFFFNIYVFILYFLGDFCLPFKAFIDVFVFFAFNKKFREASYRMLRIRDTI